MLRVDTGAGETIDVPGEYVEPVHLQVACSRLWSELPPGVTEILEEHVHALADLDTVLGRFYDDAVAAACAEARLPERRVRTWVQDELVTPGGTRSTVYRGPEKTAGLPNVALAALEDKRLVRAEQRAGALWYELTHDRLIAPIQRSNAAFAAGAARRRFRWLAAAAVGVVLLGAVVVGVLFATVSSPPAASALCRSCKAQFGSLSIEPNVPLWSVRAQHRSVRTRL